MSVALSAQVLGIMPPRLHKWFLAKFPEPVTWLQARLNFTRTNAVWCMTGHMLGLGDRHGENILIDTARWGEEGARGRDDEA